MMTKGPHRDVTVFDCVVLAGGAARRLGGADKPGLDFCGRSALDRVLDSVGDAGAVVVVGPRRRTGRHVVWTSEEPPGAGPVAALRAGLAATAADLVVVLAADLPCLDSATVVRLVDAAAGHDGAMVVSGGREQYLLAAYDRGVLARALAPLPPDAALRRAVAGLDLVRVEDRTGAARDVDTWEDVERARRRLGGSGAD